MGLKFLYSKRVLTTLLAVFLMSLLLPLSVFAASSVSITTSGLINGSFPGAPIPANSMPNPVLKISVTPSQAGQTLNSVRVNFSGTGFQTSDLAPIATDITSGVILVDDTGATVGTFDMGSDSPVTLASSPDWIPGTTNIILTPATPVALTNGVANIFYVIVATSGTITNDDRLIASLPVNGVVTSDGSGPSTAFTAFELRADTAPIQISQVSGFVGSPTLNVRFNKPARKNGGGNLLTSSFSFVDGGGSVQTISSISHTEGQDFATLTMSSALDAGDLDGTPATLAAANNAISDMGGNVMGTGLVALTSPFSITSSTIPTATVGATYTTSSPLVSFSASGGTAPYVFAPDQAGDTTVLSNAGLAIVNDAGTYKITGTVLNVPGSYSLFIKGTDSTGGSPLITSRQYTFNIATVGGAVPGVSNISPSGGPTSGSAFQVTITGVNTHFTNSSTVSFLNNNVNDTDISATVTTSTATSLTLSVTIASGASIGSRDVKVTSGSEVAVMPSGFGVFASGASGLSLLLPANGGSNVQMPPTFNFNPSDNGAINTYRVIVKSTANFSGTSLWDYVFPKPETFDNSNNSNCTLTGCNLNYGEGRFRILTQPTPLSPNTTYYWQVLTYSQSPDQVSDAATPLENSMVQSFTTTSSITDTTPPNIQHRPVFQATASTDLILFARIGDNIATTETTPALQTGLYYCVGSSCNPASGSVVNGSSAGSNYFTFTIPGASIGTAGTIVRYYLRAYDGTNEMLFKGLDNTPFQVTSTAVTANTITGSVRDGDGACSVGIQGAKVYVDGTGFNAITNGSCNFTLSGLPAGTFDVVAFKEAYTDRIISGVAAGSSGLSFSLKQGFNGGFGGDATKPHVMFTAPGDNMSNVPGGDSNLKIFLVFDKEMSQNSVTASGNLTVNEVNPATGTLIDVTSKGSWTYYPTAPGLPGLPPTSNIAVFSLSQSGCSGAPCTLGDGKTFAVTASSSVTDSSGNSIQGNQSDGGYAFTFTTGTMFTGTFESGFAFGSGAFIPPHVTGTNPTPGSFDIPINRTISINFSDGMADDSGPYVLKNFIKLYSVSGTTETNVSSLISSTSLDSSKLYVTLTLTGNLASNTTYRLKVLGGAKATSGLTLAPPGSEAISVFVTDFKTGATTDTGAPTISGSFPDTGSTGIPVNIGAVNIGFSKDMDPSTITTSTIYLALGSATVNGTVEYHPNEHQAFFIPKSALTPNTTYTLNITTGVKALNGVALATTSTRSFTTGDADANAPYLSFVNADDYALAITFSEPMNAAKATDTMNFTSSVLKAANYTIKYATVGSDSASGTVITVPSSASFSYDQTTNTVKITGYHDGSITGDTLLGKEIYVAVTGVKDLSANNINTTGGVNTGKAIIQNSSTTKGILGPSDVNAGGFETQGTFIPKNFDSATFGFAPPVEVRPFNTLPGQTTVYGIRLPLSKQIPAGGSVVLTFPAGFNVAGAKQDVNSPMRKDLNGPGTGTITFKCNPSDAPTSASCATTANTYDTGVNQGGLAGDGVTVDTNSRSVTVYISGDTNAEGHDFLSLDIAGITNSTVPKDFTTSGYTVDVKSKNASSVIESFTSNPFFIQSGGSGSYTLGGTITATGNNQNGTMQLYLMSPLTGPLDVTSSDFSGGATATYSFTNLPPGDYMLSTDQSVEIGNAQFVGKTIPEFTKVTGNTTYDMTLGSAASGGTAVTVNVTGPASEPLDVFASSPTGFRVKQITLNGGGTGSATLYLPDGNWNIGVGPQMPKGFSGPPITPSYLPPRPKLTAIADPVCTVEGTVGCTIAFTLSTSSKTIKGTVQDGSGKVIANAEVYAYSPLGGFGTRTNSDTSGNFTLNVADGSYAVGSFVPGMPSSKEVPVIVTSDATTYLLIDGATTAITPSSSSSTFVLKVAKPDYTISGKVSDGSNVIQGASVYAYRTDGPGHANVITDNSGNYTLYVSAGTWHVGSFLPQYGQLSEQTVTVSTENVSNTNFSPTQTGTGTFYTVSGSVSSGGSAVQGAFVRILGNSTNNEAITGSDGSYSMKVPSCATAGCYTLKAVAPNIGEFPPLAPFAVTGDTTGKNFSITAPRTVTVTFSSLVEKSFVDLISSTGAGAHSDVSNATETTLQLPDGNFTVHINVPGASIGLADVSGTGYNSTTGVFTVSESNTALTVTLPTLRTITGTVTDGTNNLSNTWVELVNPTTGVHFGALTTSAASPSTNFSLKVADGTYFINATKAGYFKQPSSIVVNGSTASPTIALTSATRTISGQILIGSSGAANAFVRAEKQGGGFSGTQADANGNYTLPVDSGTWKLFAVADGYKEQTYASNPIDVTTASASGKNITLATAVTVSAPVSKPITPASGGTLEDTTAGVKLTIPANALGTSASAGNIQAKETTNVHSTDTAIPLSSFDSSTGIYGPVGKEISATDNSGNPITNLNDTVTVEMSYSVAELDATRSGDDSSIDTKSEADKLTMAYWDTSSQSWSTLPSSITYKDSDGNIITSPASDLSDVTTVTIAASTNHFSLYAPIVSTDPSAPSTPTGFAAVAASSTQINLTWTQVSGATSYDIYRSTTSGGTYSRLGSEPTVSSGSTVTYSDTGLTASTAYYYKISALNASGESATSSAVNATTSATPSSSSPSVTNSGSSGGSSPSVTPASIGTTPAATTATTYNSTTQDAVVKPYTLPYFRRVYGLKSKGPIVSSLQTFLIQNGYLNSTRLKAGVFDRPTIVALKKYQRSHKLKITGRLDRKTYNAITTGGK